MSDQSIGVARIDITVDTDKMQAGVAAAQGKMAQFGAQAEAEYNKASASSKRYATSLLNQAENLGKTRAEQIAYNAQMKIGGELGKQIAEKALAQQAAMQAMAAATGKASHAVHEFSLNNSFARRELGRLVTDIAKGNYGRFEQTSLTLANASGLLGKVFSKTGAAAVGVAVGLGVLLKALLDSENETAAFDKALLTTGNIANTTVPKMQALADAIAQNGATHGQAFDAVQKTAETGRFIGAQFDLVATAAARMEESTGQSIDNTIKKFEAIAQDPVNALLKLNETEHFLTRAQLDRVQALVDEGRQQDAATEGARIYADRLNDVATAADEARPHLARMWSDSKKELSSLWDDTKNFTEFLAATADKFKQMPWYERGPFASIGYLKSLYSAEPVQPPPTPKPVANTVNSDAEEAARRAREALAKFASPTDQLKAAEDEAKKKFLAAIYGVSDPATIAKYKAQMENEVEDAKQAIARAQHKDKVGSPHASTANAGASALASFQQYVNGQNPTSLSVQGDAALTKYVQDMAKLEAKFDEATAKGADAGAATSAFWTGAADEVRKYSDALSAEMNRDKDAVAAYQASLDDMLATRQSEIDLQVQSVGMGQREITMRRALIAIDQDYNRKVADLQKRQQSTTDGLQKAYYQQQLDALKGYHDSRIQMEIDGYAAEQRAEENGMDGMKAAIKDFLDEQHNVAAQTKQFTSDFIGGFADAFTQFASGAESAKKAFGDFIDSMFAEALKFEANQAVAKFLEMIQGKHQQTFSATSLDTGFNVDSGSGSSSGGFWSEVAGLIGSYFGGGRASGGPVDAGRMYQVNENGPELLSIGASTYLMMGKDSGKVTPASGAHTADTRAAPVTVNQTIVVGSLVNRQTREQLAQETARRQRIATARNS